MFQKHQGLYIGAGGEDGFGDKEELPPVVDDGNKAYRAEYSVGKCGNRGETSDSLSSTNREHRSFPENQYSAGIRDVKTHLTL